MAVSRVRVVDALLIVLTGLGWGLLAPATKVLLAGGPAFDGVDIAVARAAWGLPLALFALAAFWRVDPPRLDAKGWATIALGGVSFAFITVLFSIATQLTSVSHIAFLVGVSPVTNTVAAALVFRLPIPRPLQFSLVLGVLGVAILAATRTGGEHGLAGDLIMLVWLVAFAGYACALRAVGARLHPGMLMALVMTVALALTLVYGLAVGEAGAIAHVADTPLDGLAFFGEVVFGSTVIAQTTYALAVRRLGVALATIGAEYLALAVGIVWSLGAHEPWNELTVVAALCFAGALAVALVPAPPRRAKASAAADS